MNDIEVFLIKSSESPYPRGLMAKSTGGTRTPGAHEPAIRTSDLSLIRELDAFIAARHPQKKKVALKFGRPSPHSPAMQALFDQIEE